MNENKERILSIIVPVFNGEDYLEQCLNSIIDQKVEGLEIIVINDGSSDKTEDIMLEYKQNYPDIFLCLNNTRSKGVSGARNTGIQKASGRYIGFLDADDILLSSTLKMRLDMIVSSNADILITDFVLFSHEPQLNYNQQGYCQKAFEKLGFRSIPIDEIEHSPIDFFIKYFCVVWMGSVLLKASSFKTNIYFDETMSHGEDEDLWYNLCAKSKIKYINKVTTGYRQHSASATVDLTKKYLGACRLRLKQLRSGRYNTSQQSQLRKKLTNEFLQLSHYLRGSNQHGVLLNHVCSYPPRLLFDRKIIKQIIAAILKR